MKSTLTAVVAAVLFALAPVSAQAANHGKHKHHGGVSDSGMGCGMMKSGKMQMGGMGGGMMGGGMMKGMSDKKLEKLKTDLAITDAQATVWDDYTKAVAAHRETMQKNMETMMKGMGESDPVQRLDAHLTAMKAGIEALEKEKTALQALYGALDDTQKQKANSALGYGCKMGSGGKM